ncbi:hypothetical protein NSP33_24520, partial [Salmonella enterica]|nr:hypothetical protein [Salmonella enterica]
VQSFRMGSIIGAVIGEALAEGIGVKGFDILQTTLAGRHFDIVEFSGFTHDDPRNKVENDVC